MASTLFTSSSLPLPLPYPHSLPKPPLNPTLYSSQTPHLSLSSKPPKNHQKLNISSSTAQSLQNPLISPHFEQTLLPFSSEDAQILYNKCFDLLHLSVSYRDVELARALHCFVVKLDEDNYLYNSLIAAYVNLGLFHDAYCVFKSMVSPDVVSYSVMISGFAKVGYECKAIEVFNGMRESGVEPNEFTFVAILSNCGRVCELDFGVQVHGLVVKLGYLCSPYVVNSLMGVYGKCGCLDDVIRLFDELSERDIASWNTVIHGVVSGMMYDRAFELFREMQRVDGFRVTQYTVSSLLSACAGCSAGVLGREVHAHALKLGFEGHLSVGNALIRFYTKYGSVKDVQALFERMPTKNVVSWTVMITAYMEFGMVDQAIEAFAKMPERNAVTFNVVLAGLCRNGEGLKALSLFKRMVSSGVELTEHTLTSVIGACSLLEEKNISEQIHSFVVKFGFRSNAYIDAALLDMCTRCGRMADAQRIFYQSQYDQNISMNWTSLICGYARSAQPEQALTLFKWGQSQEAMVVDQVVATTVLGICATLGFYEVGEQMHCHAVKSGFLFDVGVGNALISMYSKCGYVEDARRVFDSLPIRDVVSWNCLIAGYLLQRQGDEGLAVWSRMRTAFVRPDSLTLRLVISSYRYTKSNMLDDCRKVFFSMKRVYDVEPTSDHYASFVSVLGDWGSLEEAEDVLDKMDFEPKASVWRALLNSCKVYADSPAGKRTAKRILAMQPQDPSTYILISNLYSASGRWHCSEMVREEMRRKGLQKHPARSWIVHQNKVHSFYTRGKSHSQSKDIYRGLEILILECLKAGYVPDTSFVLHEVEEHQKEDFLFYHSAKLAMTFGLLMTKPGKPIRVTKNVLLCGDCHNFFKFVSKITRREICIRDSSGFHRFSGGTCSCKDHW